MFSLPFALLATPAQGGHPPTGVDPTVDPCSDFYRYACGGRDAAELGLRAAGNRNFELVAALLHRERGAAGQLFRECMDHDAIEVAGWRPLEPWLNAVHAVTSADDALRMAGSLRSLGVEVWFDLGTLDGEVVLGPIRPQRKSAERADYQRLYEQVFAEVGEPDPAAAARGVMELSDRLVAAREVMSLGMFAAGGDEPPPDPARVRSGLRPYLESAGVRYDSVKVVDPEGADAVLEVLRATPAPVLQRYLEAHLLGRAGLALHAAVRDPILAFAAPVWQPDANALCVSQVSEVAPGAISRMFEDRRIDPRAVREASGVFDQVQSEFLVAVADLGHRLGSDQEREPSQAEAVRWRLAGVREAEELAVSGSWFADWASARAALARTALASDGVPVEPFLPTAFYLPASHEVVVMKGLLRAPIYDRRAPDSAAWGALGTILGHELTHSFTDNLVPLLYFFRGMQQENQEIKFTLDDPDGLLDGISCIAENTAKTSIPGRAAINPLLTVSEAAADIGGLELSWRAWSTARRMDPPSLDERKGFFLSFAQTFCEEGATGPRTGVDPHPPGWFRVDGTLRQFPEFAEAWQCGEETPMVGGRDCRIW